MSDKKTEAYKLLDHINKDVRNGFSASVRSDGSILLSYVGYERDFEMSLEFSHEYKVWMIDGCPYAVHGAKPSIAFHKGQIGFITLALAKYNVAIEKRLNK